MRTDKPPYLLAPGEYTYEAAPEWYARTPNGLLANLSRHDVTVHEDGSITVSPSILVRTRYDSWHGYLEHGVWRSC